MDILQEHLARTSREMGVTCKVDPTGVGKVGKVRESEKNPSKMKKIVETGS